MGFLDRKFEHLASTPRRLRKLEQVGQRGQVENTRGRLAHFAHQESHSAGALIVTLLTLSVGGFARAWQRRKRPLDRAEDLPGRDLSRRLRQEVAAPASLSTVQKAMILELQKDQLEETAGNVFAGRNIRNQNRSLAIFFASTVRALSAYLDF
jgi:hypothetical protein